MVASLGESSHEPRDAGGKGRRGPQGEGPIGRLADVLHCVAVRLHRVLRRADAETGVSAAQLSALWTLLHDGPRAIRDLADAEQVSAPTMTRIVQALEAMGLAVRAPDPLDRRAVHVVATRRGRALLRAQRARAIVELGLRVQGLPYEDVAALESASRIMAELLRPTRAGRAGPGARPGPAAAHREASPAPAGRDPIARP